jgi:poly(A) polymerase
VHQKTYSSTEHSITKDQIDPDALYVMEKLIRAGHVAFLVGGSVRDLLLQRKPKDFDISTSALPEEIKQIFRNCILIGRRFRLAHVRFGRKIIEVSTFRSGDTEDASLIVRDNQWGSPEEDVLRRDFTINGLYYDPATESIIDYVGGFPDLRRKYLRTIGQPFVRFKQDPVRMLRLVKFQARFGFEIDPQARIALLDCRGDILKSSQARVLEELLRMLESGSSHTFFKLLAEYGMMHLMMPALAEVLDSPASADIYAYLDEVDRIMREPNNPPVDRSILLCCLLYPLLDDRIHHHYIDRERYPHLGEIFNEVRDLVDSVFLPFFHLSRRLRLGIFSTLCAQYRLTPLDERRHRRIRVPKDPQFPQALQFLQIRSCLEPGLQKVWEEWNEAMGQPEVEAPKRRRRRSRKRKPPVEHRQVQGEG